MTRHYTLQRRPITTTTPSISVNGDDDGNGGGDTPSYIVGVTEVPIELDHCSELQSGYLVQIPVMFKLIRSRVQGTQDQCG